MSAEELAHSRTVPLDNRVSVVGVGGAGNNLLSQAIGRGLNPTHCVAVNTDRSQLSKSQARNKVLLEEPNHNGSISEDIQVVRELQLSVHRVTPFTSASDLTIVVAGLGGATATGAAPLIAQGSRTRVRPVVSVVAIPFIHERERRFVALRGLKKMVEACDCTIVIDNSLESENPSTAGRRADEMASLALRSITDLVSKMALGQKQEFRRILSLGPIATLCSAAANPGQSLQTTVFQALKNPSAGLPLAGTRGAILVYRGHGNITEGQAAQAYETLQSLTGHSLGFLYGNVQADAEPRVCLLLTGYDYGTTIRTFADFIEDIYDLEYGQSGSGSLTGLQMPLFQMEEA